MVNRYPTSLASWSGLRNLATRLDCNLSGQGDGVSLGGLAVPALHLLLDRIEVLEKHTVVSGEAVVDQILSRIEDLEAKASGCGNAILKLTGDIERLEKRAAIDAHKFDVLPDRLDAMDRRIESLVGRSVPATECEPTALHELRAVLEYAVGLAAAPDMNQLFFNGFMECRRMMIRAIEIRLQAFD